MKKVNFWFAGLIAVAVLATTFTACSSDDDPNYVAPTISLGSTTTGEINLSDNLKFQLPVNITSEAGLASIEVKDSEGTTWLNQTSFTNPNSVSSVELDLSDCTETKILLLTIKATAKDGKVTSSTQPYSLNVYVPQLYVALSKCVTITNTATMNVTFGRGVKELSRATISVNGSKISEINFSTEESTAKKIAKSVFLTGLVNSKNEVQVDVYEAGASNAALTAVSEVACLGIIKVNESLVVKQGEYTYKYQFRRNEGSGNIDFVGFRLNALYGDEMNMETYEYEQLTDDISRYWWFTYNDKGMVTEISDTEDRAPVIGNPTEDVELNKYKFAYNEAGELTSVTRNEASYITDVVYENGVIASYKINGQDYQAKYATVENNTVRVDCLDKNLSGNTFAFTGNEALSPYYVAGLPAVIPGDVNGLPLQMLYNQYLFNSLGTIWTTGWAAETDSNGGLTYSTSYTYNNLNWSTSFSIGQ